MDADGFSWHTLLQPRRGWFILLVVALMAAIVVYPLLEGMGVPLLVVQILSRSTIVWALLAAAPPRKWFLAALVVLLLTTLINPTESGTTVRALARILEIGVLVSVIIRIMIFVFRGKISANTIFAGVCAYLLIGLLFGFVYETLSIVQGHSVLVNTEGKYASHDESFYFSYAALSTTGFGDVRPTNALGRSLSIVEALTGQLYLVLLLGRLVGLHVSQSAKSTKTTSSDGDE